MSQWWVVADQHFTNTGELDPNQTRATYITSFYGEYGISDKFTAMVYFPFFTRSLSYNQESATTGEIIKEGEAVNSIGDTELTMKYGIIQNDKIALSGSFTLGIPFGNATGGLDGSIQTGIGEWYQMVRLDASKSFQVGNKYPFVSIFGAFNHRVKNYSDEIRYGIKSGVELNQWFVSLQVTGISSLKNVENNFGNGGTSIFGNNTEYLGITPEIAYKFHENFGVTTNVGVVAWGKLILAAPSFSLGIFWVP